MWLALCCEAMKYKNSCLAALSCGLALVASCQQKGNEADEVGAFAGKSGTIDIAGGTAHIPVMKAVAKDIMMGNPDVKITIAGGGSGVGAQQVAKELVDIGNTGRPLKESEASQGLVSFPFAIDGVAVIVHPDNPVINLTSKQVAGIYAGIVTNWKEVGGKDGDIHLFTRDEASGTRSVFVKKLIKKGSVDSKAHVVISNGAMKNAVQNDPGAIGYCSIGYIDDAVKVPRLDGVEPSNVSCVSGEYPVARKLFMNTKGEPRGIVKTFIDFVTGPEGAKYISSSGYIPLNAEE